MPTISRWIKSLEAFYYCFRVKPWFKREVDFLVTKNKKPWFLVEVKNSDSQGINKSLYYFQ